MGLERRPMMPWNEVTTVKLRAEFVRLAQSEGANISQLCARFQISRKTGYKWLARFRCHGDSGLGDQSRRPAVSPSQTPSDVEADVLRLRDQHPAWGGRKIHARLVALNRHNVPAPSTITAILRRHGRIEPGAAPRAFIRFQRDRPNELWQMDFKGHFPTAAGRCHPLTILGDHGPPWGTAGAETPWTGLSIWLLKLGIRVSHGRAFHPQTQGKDERFHRTHGATDAVRKVSIDGTISYKGKAFPPGKAFRGE